jgi:ribosomal protein S25
VDRKTKEFEEAFYHWPEQEEEMNMHIETWQGSFDVYFSPMIYSSPKRVKGNVIGTGCAWSDLDTCHPDNCLVPPSVVLQTSPGRWQGFWICQDLDPFEAEDFSRRIAYAHESDGADRSGWDLTQLLRVPHTTNHKYPDKPEIDLGPMGGVTTKEILEEAYPASVAYETSIPLPSVGEGLPEETAEELLDKFAMRIPPMGMQLYTTEPEADWSKHMWQLQMILLEAGMSPQQAFVVMQEAACNKYRRDQRANSYLWKDILRAFTKFESLHRTLTTAQTQQPLMSQEEREAAKNDHTFVEEYVEWAKTLGDAAWQYHQAGAFICLSSMLAGPVRLPTSYGVMVPNLWFMILADTTLTRKTTAMDIAMDLVMEVDPDVILATDGSIEGLFTSLSLRPGQPSIFLRDEFSGLLEQMNKKDYYAGMAETFTKMYDGKMQKRVLRKEVITVNEPVLIMFTGGIRERILSLLDYDSVSSGFLPRFLFITAESDITRLRPLGPPTERSIGKRELIRARLATIHGHYRRLQEVSVNGTKLVGQKRWDASLTPEAWERYNKFEADMLKHGFESANRDLVTPVFDRLSKSTLKMAVLVAAARNLTDRVVVEERDLIKAIYYVEQWREFVAQIINSVGRTAAEKTIDKVYESVVKKPGVTRSELMQHHRLTAREADNVFTTLDQRGRLQRIKSGRTERLYPIQASTLPVEV